MSVILAAFSSRPSSSSTSSTSRSRGRPYTSMDSIYSIVAGLGLRLVVGYASHHEFKIVGPLIGLWEGVVTLHFMKKAPSSFDPFVAYGVRMFIDYLVTENVSRMVLVVIWTVLGMALADVAPSIWFDVGLHRPWRRVRRDLYTLYSMTPKVPSFPKARAVRFSRSRNTVIDTPITFPEIDIEERRTLKSTSATRRRVSGSRFTTSVAPNSDCRRRATVYAEPPSDTDDTGTVISDDLDVDNLSSGRSSTSPPSSQGTPHHEDWDLESSIESAPEIDVEEEIAAAQEEAEQQQHSKHELAQAKKDHGEEGESTPRARPMIFPPTPSDSAARWDLSYNDHAVPPPSAFLQQIPDDVQDYDYVPATRGVLPPVVTLNMVKEEESDRPPPTPAKDDIPLRFRKGGASASAISTNRQYTPMSSRNSLGLETPAETPVDGNGAASTGASRVGGLSDDWASAPQPSSSKGSPSSYASVPTRLDRGPSIAIPQGPVADLMGLDTPSSAAEEDDMYLDEEESRSRVEQYMRNVAESQKDDDDEAEYQALLEFREKERRQEEEMVRLEEERRRRDEMERLRLQDAERLRLAQERRARLEEKRRVQEEERRTAPGGGGPGLKNKARLERLRQEEEEEAEAQRLAQEARLAKRLRFAQEAEERARLAEEEAKARLAEQLRLAEEAERIRLAAEELERVRLAEEAERIRLAEEQEAELRRLQEEAGGGAYYRSRIEQEQEAELRRLQEERSRIEQEEAAERSPEEKEQLKLKKEEKKRKKKEREEKKRKAEEDAAAEAEAERERVEAARVEAERLEEERLERELREAREAEEKRLADEAEEKQRRIEEALALAERIREEEEAEQHRVAQEALVAEQLRLAEEEEQRRAVEVTLEAERKEEEDRRLAEEASQAEALRQQLEEDAETQRLAEEAAAEQQRLADEEAARVKKEQEEEDERLREQQAVAEAARAKEQEEEEERLRQQQATAEADLAAATAAEEAKRAELERLEEEQAAATRAAEELAAAQAQVDAEAPPVPEKEPASAEPGTPTQVMVQLATPTAPAADIDGGQEGEGEENVDDDALLGGGSDIGSVATAYTEVSLDVKSRLEKTISRRAQKIELEDRVAVLRKYQKKIQRLYDDSTRLSMFWETPAKNFMLKIATIPEVEERVRDALLFHLTPDCKSFNFTITIPSGKGPAVTRIKNAVVALLRDQLNIEPAAKDPNNGKILTLEMDEKDFPLWILDFRQRSTRGD
ncbi:hypothetical protein DFP72DRAFT_875180 [Ephemerocybe angulata]|uniref:Uncharacterized protein n=1 Tax=Ephemerocybe angulata TaxID=980116 RepID=A0A8H6ICY4_9AGAR|nr:hypothetical protein DFP72DRAFT_875180 [Tulosesus angulatus]